MGKHLYVLPFAGHMTILPETVYDGILQVLWDNKFFSLKTSNGTHLHDDRVAHQFDAN